MKKIFVAALLTISMPITCSAGWFEDRGPETYEDCILRNMKGVTSDIAAKSIKSACYKKEEERERKILDEKMARIKPWPLMNQINVKGKAAVIETGDGRVGIRAQLFNDDTEWELLRVTISVVDKKTGVITRVTHAEPPITYVWLYPKVIPEDWSWSIDSLEGVPITKEK